MGLTKVDSGDYLTLNLSCPNTETGRDFFAEKDHLVRCLRALSKLEICCPVFLKISPLGGIAAIENVLEATAAQAYEKIKRGSSLVQLFTALIYQGPFVVQKINRGLAELLQKDGFKTVAEAVGQGVI